MRKIATTFCTQCNAMLEPGSKQCGQAYSAGEPMQMRSWDTQDADNEWLIVRTQMPVKCFEAARNERGNVRWPKDPDALVSVVEIDIPAPVRPVPVPLPQALEESIGDNPDLFGAPSDPVVDPRDAELEALRARVAELEASPPPSPAVVALEGMEALKAKLDAGRAQVPSDLAEALAGEDVSSPEAVAKLTERLNIEKAELRRVRLGGGTPTEREPQVDRLLNWLAQFGEA